MTAPCLASLQVGRARRIDAAEPWESAIFKSPVDAPVLLTANGLLGDEQADRTVHGGPDKAVCVYSADHYDEWRRTPGLAAMGAGAFGENFTVLGQDETTVSVGDRFAVGRAVVAVSQPRGPCWKLARRWSKPDLPRRVLATNRTGWYLRVIAEGPVQAGAPLELLERPHPQWTIARVNEVTFRETPGRRATIEALAACDELAADWRAALSRRFL